MIRLTGRGSPAEDTKQGHSGVARYTVSVLRGCRRASLKHRARNAGRSAVRGDYAHADKLNIPHGAMGRLKARRSARPFLWRGLKAVVKASGVPRADKQQGR